MLCHFSSHLTSYSKDTMSVNKPILPNINVPNAYMKLKNRQNPCNAKMQSSVYDLTCIKDVLLLQKVQIFIQLQKFIPQH